MHNGCAVGVTCLRARNFRPSAEVITLLKGRTVVASCVAVVATIIAAHASAYAYETFNNHRLVYGVSGQQYWIGSEALANEAQIVSGVSNWNSAMAIVSFSRTYTRANARLEFTRIATNDAYCAVTYMYGGAGEVSPFSQDWFYAKAQIRPQLDNTGACGASNHRQGILAHEMGHAMGVAHPATNVGARLMRADIASLTVNNPQTDDIAAVDFLY